MHFDASFIPCLIRAGAIVSGQKIQGPFDKKNR